MTGNRKLKVFYWTMIMIQSTFVAALFAGVSGIDSTTIMSVIGAHTANAIFFVGGNVGEHFANGKNIPVAGEVKS